MCATSPSCAGWRRAESGRDAGGAAPRDAEPVGWLELFFDLVVVVVCTAVRAVGSIAIAAAAAVGGSIDTLWFVVLLLVAVGWTVAPLRADRGPGAAED